jgi:ribosomal protein S18 acetylase RimI-like enzyme
LKGIVVRRPKSNELAAARNVSMLAFRRHRKTYRPTDEANSKKADVTPSLNRLVAIADNDVIGTMEYELQVDAVHLVGLATHPDYARRGIARALLNKLEQLAEENGLSKITLYTIKQTGNVEVFKKLGFDAVSGEITTLFDSDMYDELIEVRMEKILRRREE